MKDEMPLPLLFIPYEYELHLEKKELKEAEEPVCEEVKMIRGLDKADFGFEKEPDGEDKVSITFGFGSLKLKKADFDEAIRRYQHNCGANS